MGVLCVEKLKNTFYTVYVCERMMRGTTNALPGDDDFHIHKEQTVNENLCQVRAVFDQFNLILVAVR